jgi:isochorismate synthase
MELDLATVEPAAALLDGYTAGDSFFFASPRGTMLAQGAAAVLPEGDTATLPERVAALLRGVRGAHDGRALVVGALPFAPDTPAHLVLPAEVYTADPLRLDPDTPERPLVATFALQPVPEQAAYADGVEAALARLRCGELRKVVLARALQLNALTPISTHQLLHNLARRNPDGYTFAVDLPSAAGRRRTLVGASPELLISRTGAHVVSNPLAGSAPRCDNPAEDRRRAEALLASAKDHHEHALVVEAVAGTLRRFCRRLDVPRAPSLVQTPTMWHLSTRICGTLADPATSALELAVALHPTPAICGTPAEQARAAIEAIEPFERGFYSGAVGWCNAAGDGEWAVAIRCAEVSGRGVRLFAGAGIVPGSRPEDELAETGAKFRTMLQALGLGQSCEALL